MSKYDNECYATGCVRLIVVPGVPDGDVTVRCKMTYHDHKVYGDQVRIELVARTDCPSISER
jgi:hypothetical protein